jgi:GDP-L-fucose synthase
MPTNLYGPGDNYHLQNSHVIPAIIRKCHLAKLAAEGDGAGIERDQQLFGPITEDIASTIFESDNRTLRRSPYVQLWGSGNGRREFLHVDDMAAACHTVMKLDSEGYEKSLNPTGSEPSSASSRPSFINIGTGKDCTIAEAAAMVQKVVGYQGEIRYDSSQPDGTPRKLLDVSRIRGLGWQPRFSLLSGLQDTYDHYRACQGGS